MSKTVLVTGAAQGIGAAIARRFAKEGYQVAVNIRNESSLERGGRQVLEDCRALGAQAECFFGDVSDFTRCGEMVKEVQQRFGSLDVLVNNAGITRDTLLPRMSEEQFDEVIASNLKSVFNLMHFASAVMMKQRSGRIINLTSVVGLYGNPGQANYSASKAGIIGLTKSAAKELGGRGITVNAIAPGFIETPMTAALNEKQREIMLSAISLKRYGKPEEIAGTALFLASEDAAYITGQVIEVDGGIIM